MKFPSWRRRFNPKVMAVAAVAAGALVAVVMPVGADVSASSPPLGLVRVESPATLQARGAAITVDVTFVGPPTDPVSYPLGNLTLTVTERVGQQVATGSVNSNIGWFTGGAETMRLTVVAQPGGPPFRTGSAFASATMQVNVYPYAPPATDERQIQISR
jgi:hypothetical protein